MERLLREARAPKRNAEVDEFVSVVYVTDLHLWGNGPVNRIGSYLNDLNYKLGQVLEYAEQHSAELLIFGGDLFHSAGPSFPLMVLNSLIATLREFSDRTHCPIMMCVGEHDMHGRAFSTYPWGPIGTFDLLRACFVGVNLEHPGGSAVADFLSGSDLVRVAAIPAPLDNESDTELGKVAGLVDELNNNAVHAPPDIICLHHPVHTGNPPWSFIPASSLPVLPGQVILCGHVHDNLGVNRMRSGGYVVIPGAMTRRQHTEAKNRTGFVHVMVPRRAIRDRHETVVSRVELTMPEESAGLELGSRFRSLGREFSTDTESGVEELRALMVGGATKSPEELLRASLLSEVPEVRSAAMDLYSAVTSGEE